MVNWLLSTDDVLESTLIVVAVVTCSPLPKEAAPYDVEFKTEYALLKCFLVVKLSIFYHIFPSNDTFLQKRV